MKTITIQELETIPVSHRTILDIRQPEDYRSGTIKDAINLPRNELEEKLSAIPKENPVYLLCYTGNRSEEIIEKLEAAGYDAVNIEGGYRSYLTSHLLSDTLDEAALQEKTKEIEGSIIKTFRKRLWRPFTRAVKEYEFIQEGDKIAVCISGGKDSMLLAKLMQEIQRHGQVHFDLVFLCMNPGYNEENWKIIQNNAKILGIPLTVFNSEIFDVVVDIDKNPCYLCARMRRGYLYSHAKELGCNKIALGHHFDDVIETILMGMMYGGKIETMMPKLHSQNFEGMQLIRPMYMVKEADIKAWRDHHGLHFIQCACRFTENNTTHTEDSSKRQEMKQLISQLRKTSDVIESNIFRSVHNVNLRTLIGYHKDDWEYNFLDDYESYANRGQKNDCGEDEGAVPPRL